MEWSGVEQTRMEINGLEWSEVEWSRMERNGVEWDREWSGMDWHGMAYYISESIARSQGKNVS